MFALRRLALRRLGMGANKMMRNDSLPTHSGFVFTEYPQEYQLERGQVLDSKLSDGSMNFQERYRLRITNHLPRACSVGIHVMFGFEEISIPLLDVAGVNPIRLQL